MPSRKPCRLGMLILVAAMAACCGKNTTNDIKTISSKLSGKWEVNKILLNGIEHSLPYSGINTGGYLFGPSSLTSYINGNVSFEMPGVYTEDNRFYGLAGQAGYFYIITENTLNILLDGSGGIFATKVSSFSWE